MISHRLPNASILDGSVTVELSAAAAISNPSKLMMCQKGSPRRTILSAQR